MFGAWDRFAVALTGILVAAAGLVGAGSAAAEDDPGPVCQRTETSAKILLVVPVAVVGTLCKPSAGEAKAVQVLVHGGTYSGKPYWDPDYQPERFSHVRDATKAGYATWVIDRVGYGESTRPLSALLTGSVQANVVHQLIGKLRGGGIDGNRWDKVVLVGHSLGSGISLLEAATYKDVDAVALTGMTHHISPTSTLNAFLSYLQPAILDPKYRSSPPDPGYLTTRPGARDDFFYAPGDADPGIPAADEASKDLVAAAEVSDLVTVAFTSPISRLIDVPVLMAVGGEDGIFCRGLASSDCATANGLKSQENGYFSAAACLQTYVLRGSGHDVNLSVNAGKYRTELLRWTDSALAAEPDCAGIYQPDQFN